jgi:hypothetical protein
MKIVINSGFGGFGLSYQGVMHYAKLKGFVLYPFLDHCTREVYKERAVIGNPGLLHHYSRVPLEGLPIGKDGDPVLPSGSYFSVLDIPRDDLALIQTVGELGKDANGKFADLKIVEIPDGIEYEIEAYDGNETIAEVHRTWA